MSTFGPGSDFLELDGRVISPLTVARTRAERRRGLLGSDSLEGALWLHPCGSVHCVGMRYTIDAALLDRRGRVLSVRTLKPRSMTWPSLRVSTVVEAPEGALTRWGVRPGLVLTVRPGPGPEDH